MARWRPVATIVALGALAIAVVAMSASYLYQPAAELRFVEQRAAFAEALWAIRLHAAGGMVALLLGPAQLADGLRARWPVAHRWLGRTSLIAIAAGTIGAFGLAPTAFGGAPSGVGFGLLALAWLVCAGQGYRAIRRRDVARHRAWMIRAFALTFAAVTLRIELVSLTAAGLEFVDAYRIVAWLSWVPNLVLVELWLRRRGAAKPRTTG